MANIQSLPVHCDEISEPLMGQFVSDNLDHFFSVANRRFLFIVQQPSFSGLPKQKWELCCQNAKEFSQFKNL
jgi:hypothetical protein